MNKFKKQVLIYSLMLVLVLAGVVSSEEFGYNFLEEGQNLNRDRTRTLEVIVNSSNSTFGSMWNHSDDDPMVIALPVQDEWFNVTGFRPGLLNKVTFDNDSLIIQEAGPYDVSAGFGFGNAGGGANDEYQLAIFLNGVEQEECETHRKLSTAGDVGSASTTPCTLELAVDDEIRLGARNRDSTTALRIFVYSVKVDKEEVQSTGGTTIASTNFSNFTEVWITAEGFKDNVSQILGSEITNDEGWISSITNIFDQFLNTTNNVTFQNVTADWFFGKINWSNIQNIVIPNIFDQSLNTTDNVNFTSVNATNLSSNGYLLGDGFMGTMQMRVAPSNSDACYNRDTDKIFNLNITDITQVDYVIYEASGYTFGCSDASWYLEVHNGTDTVIEQERTGTWSCGGEPTMDPADNWNVRGIDTTPEANANYHLNLDEVDGSSSVCVNSATLTAVLK